MGMALDMLFVGIVTGVGLWIVGVPLPFALGVLTGVAVFVPYIGPTAATIPGLLLALSVSPTLAFYAAIVYAVALTIEGNVTQPLLQRWAGVALARPQPACHRGFRDHFRAWGAVLATPMAVALSVLVRKGYVEDVLERATRATNITKADKARVAPARRFLAKSRAFLAERWTKRPENPRISEKCVRPRN